MRVQIVISGLLLDPRCDVGADFLFITALEDWPITNKVLIYFFILRSGALGVYLEYFIRLVITALVVDCFGFLCREFMVNESHTFYKATWLHGNQIIRLIYVKPAS